MKLRRHHNNKGSRRIKRDNVWIQVKAMAKRAGVTYAPRIEAAQRTAQTFGSEKLSD